MSKIIRVTSPSGPNGKDPNDLRDDPTYKSRLEEEIEKNKYPLLAKLKSLSATNRLEEMEKNLNNGVFIFDGMALAGQITLFYAKPSTGKTLFFLNFIINAIKAGHIKGEDVFYINADDNYDGLTTKVNIAKNFGFYMISPADTNLSSNEILEMLGDIAITEDISNKVIIMDTLKKFADMMNKRALADLFEVLRRLVTKGATVIIAGHANKHLDANGNLVYEGTSDIMNDIDCGYSMYQMSDYEDEKQVVEFRLEKNRGKNIPKVSYQYTKNPDTEYSYIDMVNSVTKLDDRHAKALSVEQSKSDIRQKFESEQLFIVDLLTEHGSMNQSEIMKAYKDQKADGIASEISERGLRKALDKLTEIDWTVRKEAKNAKVFTLIDKPKPLFSTSPEKDKLK